VGADADHREGESSKARVPTSPIRASGPEDSDSKSGEGARTGKIPQTASHSGVPPIRDFAKARSLQGDAGATDVSKSMTERQLQAHRSSKQARGGSARGAAIPQHRGQPSPLATAGAKAVGFNVSRGSSARLGSGTSSHLNVRPELTAESARRAQKFGAAPPLVGLDGRVVDIGSDSAIAGLESEARMNRQLGQWKEASYAELSRLVSRLRAEYDMLRMRNKERQKAVGDVMLELSRLESVASAGIEHQKAADSLSQEARAIDDRVTETKDLLYREDRRASTLQHMIVRLKGQRTEMDMAVRRLQNEAHLLQKQVDEAGMGLQGTRAERVRARALVTRLGEQLDSDRDQRSRKIAEVDAVMGEQEQRRKAFDDREKRRVNIAHLPRGDLDEAGEDRLKQLFVVRRIFASMLSRRLREDSRRCDKLQAAFQRIRGATGLSDTEDIVAKFLHRDEAVAALRSQLQASRDRLESTRRERQRLAWRLDQMEAAAGAGAGRKRAQYATLEARMRKHAEATRHCRERRKRVERLTVMLEDCRACVAKMITRLGIPVMVEPARSFVDDPREPVTERHDASLIDTASLAEAIVTTARDQSQASLPVPASKGTHKSPRLSAEGATPAIAAPRASSPIARGAAAELQSATSLEPVPKLQPFNSSSTLGVSMLDADGAPLGKGESSLAGGSGAVRVTLETLDSAIAQVETAVSRALSQLTAAMERDEVRANRRMAESAPSGAIPTPAQAGGVTEPEPETVDPSNLRVIPRRTSDSVNVATSFDTAATTPGGPRGKEQQGRPALAAADLKRLQRMLANKGDGGPVPGSSAIGGLRAMLQTRGDGPEEEDVEDLFSRHDIKRVSAMLIGQAGGGATSSSSVLPHAAAATLGSEAKRWGKRTHKGGKHRDEPDTEAAEALAEAEASKPRAIALGYIGPISTPRPHDKASVMVTTDDPRVRHAVEAGTLDVKDAESQFPKTVKLAQSASRPDQDYSGLHRAFGSSAETDS
jgi:hypothetical protein